MSRAFVKEDDAGQPPIIPPRAALPAGTPNYVTPNGLALLRKELSELEAERAQMDANHHNEADRTQQLSILNGRLSALVERVSTARVIEPPQPPTDHVRFGATVTLQTLDGHTSHERIFTIVGVDEASIAEGRVAFVAPIARAIQGAKLGQSVTLRMGTGEEVVKIVSISYAGTANRQAGNC